MPLTWMMEYGIVASRRSGSVHFQVWAPRRKRLLNQATQGISAQLSKALEYSHTKGCQGDR